MIKIFEDSVTQIIEREILYRYLHGGRAIVRLVSPSGKSHDYIFQKPVEPSEFPDDYIFVYALHNNTKKFYIGLLEDDEFRLTKNSRFLPDTEIVKGAVYIVRMMNDEKLFDSTRMKIYNGGCCARCGRKLESEKYRELGYGPKCWKKIKNDFVESVEEPFDEVSE